MVGGGRAASGSGRDRSGLGGPELYSWPSIFSEEGPLFESEALEGPLAFRRPIANHLYQAASPGTANDDNVCLLFLFSTSFPALTLCLLTVLVLGLLTVLVLVHVESQLFGDKQK
jgi:hypothetical protein